MQESIVFLVRVQCRRKESSRSLSHLLMSFLLLLCVLAFECKPLSLFHGKFSDPRFHFGESTARE